MFPESIEMELSRRRQQRMPMQDYDTLSRLARQLLEAFAQINFLARKKFIAESAYFAERGRLTKDKRTRQPVQAPADPVPEPYSEVGHGMITREPHGAAPGQALTTGDLLRDLRE